MEEFIKMFKPLSDKTRLRIMWILGKARKKLCVCEIMDVLNATQYNVSRHLRELKLAGLVREQRKGRWVFYSLVFPTSRCHKLLLRSIQSLPPEVFSADKTRLRRRLSLRKAGKCVVGMKSREWRRAVSQISARKANGTSKRK
jgi:ArsR family transcriptional regulator